MTLHDQVHPFADGELSPQEADDFRVHLGGCARCQGELSDILQLQALPAQAPARPAARLFHLPRSLLLMGSALAASVLLVALVALRRPEADAPVQLALASTRTFEGRMAYGGASDWRPYGVSRAGAQLEEPVALPLLARLEAQGQWHGLGAGQLLRGDFAAAQAALDKAGPGADVEADRAALALAKGDAAQALGHAASALRQREGHPAALWNYALAARALGMPALAAQTFGALATGGERGWSEEAKARAAALLHEGERRAGAPAVDLGSGPAAAPPARCEEGAAAACALAWAQSARGAVEAGAPDAAARLERAVAEASRAEAFGVERALLPLREQLARRDGHTALADALAREAKARAP